MGSGSSGTRPPPRPTPGASTAPRRCARSPGSGTPRATSSRSSRSEPRMGAVLPPGDPGYDDARRGYNLLHDLHPALIVRPADAGDVARALGLAAGAGLEVAVRSGGHSLAGHGGTE